MSCGASPKGHKKFCGNCGAPLSEIQIICVKCGVAVNESEQPKLRKVPLLKRFALPLNRNTALIVAGVVVLLIFVIAGSLLWRNAAVKTLQDSINPDIFKPVNRIIKQVKASWENEISLQEFKTQIKQLATEVSVLEDEVKTKTEKDALMLYQKVLECFQDAESLWVASTKLNMAEVDKLITESGFGGDDDYKLSTSSFITIFCPF
ncbi:hypothetical protein FACS189454_09980 [Planctomycetales bacterium]|nr:hypothetical protein FACS189454_09980 [Planctomycetales bacterium]